MAGKFRRRDVKGKGKEKAVDDTRPITEEEQDEVIRKLRANSDSAKKTARMWLDIIVMIGTMMSARSALRYVETGAPVFLVILTVAQTLVLPFSLSPGWLGSRIKLVNDVSENYHQIITGLQLMLFMAIFLGYRNDPALPPTKMIDFLRWALPELVTGAVEIQRSSERESEKSIRDLEKLRYDLKGA